MGGPPLEEGHGAASLDHPPAPRSDAQNWEACLSLVRRMAKRLPNCQPRTVKSASERLELVALAVTAVATASFDTRAAPCVLTWILHLSMLVGPVADEVVLEGGLPLLGARDDRARLALDPPQGDSEEELFSRQATISLSKRISRTEETTTALVSRRSRLSSSSCAPTWALKPSTFRRTAYMRA